MNRIDAYARKAGIPAAEDQLRCALMLSLDTVKVMVRDDQDEIPILLVPPLHPASLAWLIDFGDLVWEWTRNAYDPANKPTYQSVVEQMGIGPRSMALATFERGMDSPAWWGYGGNLTGAWQAFTCQSPARVTSGRETGQGHYSRRWASRHARLELASKTPDGSAPALRNTPCSIPT